MGRKLLDCVTVITEHRAQSSVKKERDNIFQWIGLVKHLHCEKEAENILCQINKLAKSIKHLIKQFNLINLHITEGGFMTPMLINMMTSASQIPGLIFVPKSQSGLSHWTVNTYSD